MKNYRSFIRSWWIRNPRWPNGLQPCIGEKKSIEYHHTEEDARARCKEYNENNEPGELSIKCEYESV